MDYLDKYFDTLKKEAIGFVESLLKENNDFCSLDFEMQTQVVCFAASVLTTFRLIQLSNKLRGIDFFKD